MKAPRILLNNLLKKSHILAVLGLGTLAIFGNLVLVHAADPPAPTPNTAYWCVKNGTNLNDATALDADKPDPSVIDSSQQNPLNNIDPKTSATNPLLCKPGYSPVVKSTKAFDSSLDASKDCSIVTREWLCKNNGQNQNSFINVMNDISNFIIIIFGSVATVLILFYIVRIVGSAGSPDQISAAKKHLAQVAISLGLLIAAYAIIQLIGISFNVGG